MHAARFACGRCCHRQTICVQVTAPTYSRKVKIPPLWNFQTAGDCPRPTYKAPAGTIAYYTNEARK